MKQNLLKKMWMLIFAIFVITPASGNCTDGFTLPFSDSFEDNDNCWTVHDMDAGKNNSEWRRTQEMLYYYEGAERIYYPAFRTGTNGYICKSGDYPKSLLLSPKIKIPAGKTSRLSFWSMTDLSRGDASVRIYTATTNLTQGYTSLWGPAGYHSQYPPAWENIVLDLSPFAGQDIYIGFYYDGGWMGLTWCIDDVDVYSLFEHDAGVTSVNAPQSGTDLGQEKVSVTLKNFGTQSITSLPVSIELNGQLVATETFAGNIPSEGQSVFTFSAPVDLSAVQTHKLKVYTGLAGEQNRANDTLTVDIHNSGHFEITQFPYTEGFEDDNTLVFWKQEVIKYYENKLYWTFEKGIPSVLYSIPTAHTGKRNAVFSTIDLSLYESTKQQITKLISPKIKLAPLQAPLLKFWHAQPGSVNVGMDTLLVYYKNSAAGTWKLLYREDRKLRNWTQTILALPEASDDYYIAFEASTGIGYGVGIDDVTVESSDEVDVKMLAVTAPVTGNDLSDETVSIRLQNFGKQTLTNIPVILRVDNQTIVTENIPGPVATFEEATYNFTQKINLSAEKTYQIEVIAAMPGDAQHYNDTARTVVTNYGNKAVMGTSRTVTSCGVNFTDDGVDGNYSRSGDETQVITFYPAAASDDPVRRVKADFTSFKLTPFELWNQAFFDGDSLIVYDGDVIDPNYRIAVLLDTLDLPYSVVSHAGNGALTFVFHKVSSASAAGWEAEVSCVVPDAKDAGILKILSPVKGGNAADHVTVQIKNFGSETISDFDIAYYFQDVLPDVLEDQRPADPVIERYTGSIAPGKIVEYTFTQKVNLSNYSENYFLRVYTLLDGDADATNDGSTANYFYRENVELSGFSLWQAGLGNTFKPVLFGANNPETLTNITTAYDVNTSGVVVAGAYGDNYLYAYTANRADASPKNFVKLTKDFGVISSTPVSSDPVSGGGNAFLPADMTYDFSTNTLYAIWVETVPAKGEVTPYLLEIDKNTGGIMGSIQVQYMLACIAAGSNGDMYGISDNGYFCSVDKYTGAVTPISHTGIWMVRDWQSMTFDHRTGRLFWAASSGALGNLYELHLDGRVDDLGPVGASSEISALFTPYVPAGIPAIAGQQPLSVYPNPVSADLHIRGLVKKTQVTITDITGKTVLQQVVAPDENIPVGHLPVGVYLVKTNQGVVRVIKR